MPISLVMHAGLGAARSAACGLFVRSERRCVSWYGRSEFLMDGWLLKSVLDCLFVHVLRV
jgi:hypothetical protein